MSYGAAQRLNLATMTVYQIEKRTLLVPGITSQGMLWNEYHLYETTRLHINFTRVTHGLLLIAVSKISFVLGKQTDSVIAVYILSISLSQNLLSNLYGRQMTSLFINIGK